MLGWDEGKKAHLELADQAAEAYRIYGTTNSATRSYMEYEEHTIREAAKDLAKHSRALDLGCGEGRISFVLADFFDDVTGYDMSTEMIRVADQRRLQEWRGNTRFVVRDLELELLADVKPEAVDLVVGSFGMGSFVESPELLLPEIERVLRPGGRAVLSFYNSRSLVHQLPLPDDWEASLAAVIDTGGQDGLVVTFGGQRFTISARAYTVDEVLRLCGINFRDTSAVTFPAISAILPQSVGGHPQAIEICDSIDRALAKEVALNVGAYILATATKDGQTRPQSNSAEKGYQRLLHLLNESGLDAGITEHAPVDTIEDVRRHIDAPASRLLKSILLAIDSPAETRYLLCLVASDRRVSLPKLARELGTSRGQLRLARHQEIQDITGFPAGALSPLGMPANVPVVLDTTTLAGAQDGDIWCGVGKRTESLRASLSALQRTVGMSVRDISDSEKNGAGSPCA